MGQRRGRGAVLAVPVMLAAAAAAALSGCSGDASSSTSGASTDSTPSALQPGGASPGAGAGGGGGSAASGRGASAMPTPPATASVALPRVDAAGSTTGRPLRFTARNGFAVWVACTGGADVTVSWSAPGGSNRAVSCDRPERIDVAGATRTQAINVTAAPGVRWSLTVTTS